MGAFWLLSFLVFGLFGWMLFKAYRYTTLSVGAESPEFHRVTRTFPAWRYFTRTTPVGLGFLSILWGLIACLLFVASFPDLWARLAVLITVFGFNLLIGIGWKLEMQYWRLVRGIALTFDPNVPSLNVERAGYQFLITPTALERIELHTTLSGAYLFAEYEYLLFFLHDGRIVRLSRMFFFEHEFLQKHFGTVPMEYRRHRIPWVKPLPVSS